MTIGNVHNSNEYVLLRCISGSRAFGLDTPTSDTDIKGVFYLPPKAFYGLDYTPQVANGTNDIVYYELKRFIELLEKNNPNILELLCTPRESILYRHPIMDRIRPELFLSKLCLDSFCGYAMTQIKKAKGLNKKIFNPVERERKSVLDFCFVVDAHRSLPLASWLEKEGFRQEDCGLVNIPHAKDLYALFHNDQYDGMGLKGIYSGEDANDVSVSSIPKGLEPKAIISFNKDGYSAYCKEYSAYWKWVSNRNKQRYEHTLELGKNYDAKNMMHTFRLLQMSYEIATEQKVIVKRPDREFLFKIKYGEFGFEQLMDMAEKLMHKIKGAYSIADLQEKPDTNIVNQLLYEIRAELYK